MLAPAPRSTFLVKQNIANYKVSWNTYSYYTFSYGFQYCFSAAARSKAACFRFFCWASHLLYFGVLFGGTPMANIYP